MRGGVMTQVTEHLQTHGVPFAAIAHQQAYTSIAEARALGPGSPGRAWLADRGPAATPLALPSAARPGQRQDLSLPRARICEPAGAPQAMRPGQEKTSAGQAPEPAVPRR